MKKYVYYLLGIVMVAFLINGCSKNAKMLKGNEAGNRTNTTQSNIKYPSLGNTENKQITSAEALQNSILSLKKDIHFKFNSSNLESIDEYGISENPVDILDNIATIMINNPSVKIRIEGNCDERGTEEYNLALGQKRALAAKKYLEVKGINPERITILSYGESQPVDLGHSEEAWAKNRRDHFVFIR